MKSKSHATYGEKVSVTIGLQRFELDVMYDDINMSENKKCLLALKQHKKKVNEAILHCECFESCNKPNKLNKFFEWVGSKVLGD